MKSIGKSVKQKSYNLVFLIMHATYILFIFRASIFSYNIIHWTNDFPQKNCKQSHYYLFFVFSSIPIKSSKSTSYYEIIFHLQFQVMDHFQFFEIDTSWKGEVWKLECDFKKHLNSLFYILFSYFAVVIIIQAEFL